MIWIYPKFLDGMEFPPMVGEMVLDMASARKLPARFSIALNDDRVVEIKDKTTGKNALVPRENYGVVRRALIQLFG